MTATAGSCSAPRTRPPSAELSRALTDAGALVLELVPEPGDARGPVLRPHRGRRAPNGAAPRADRRTRSRSGGMRPGVLTVYRWELRKLRFQKRTYLGLGAAARRADHLRASRSRRRSGGPEDVAFGRYIHDTGLAIPLVLLLFGSIWMFPLITALVAGDIVAAEDHNGTLKTILTRSVERGAGLRRQGARDGDATRSRRSLLTGTVAVVAGLDRVGLQPAPDAVGHDDLSPAAALVLLGAQPARLPDADPRDRGDRPAVLDGLPQQRRGGRRDADGRRC